MVPDAANRPESTRNAQGFPQAECIYPLRVGNVILWATAIGGAWLFACVAFVTLLRGGTRRATPKPKSDLETRVGALERSYEGLHGDYLKLRQRFNRARYDDRQEQERQVPQNGEGDQRDLSEDPRFSEYFN
jgi:hypothetical protein